MNVVDQLDKSAREGLRAATPPTWFEPMLATLTEDYFSDERWCFERKLDGERVLAFCTDDGVRLRSRNRTAWLKFKCAHGQELVVGGFTEPHGSRHGFGALLLGYHAGSDFVYAGKVGTGFDDATLRHLGAKLEDLERDRSPFTRGEPSTAGVHWVAPRLVCEVAFTEWTREGRLRHPRYLGLRTDKDPAHVVRESPRSVT